MQIHPYGFGDGWSALISDGRRGGSGTACAAMHPTIQAKAAPMRAP
jgi:hypothetical protein